MIYQVVLKVGYYERWFEFDDPDAAMKFAVTALAHDVESEDHKEKDLYVTVRVAYKDPVKEEEEE